MYCMVIIVNNAALLGLNQQEKGRMLESEANMVS